MIDNPHLQFSTGGQIMCQSIPSVTIPLGNTGSFDQIFAEGQEFDQGGIFDVKVN